MLAIWVDMMPGDSRSAWPRGMFDDPRVTNLWDASDLSGRWFAAHGTAHLGGRTVPVWDAYLGYGPDARWKSAPTEPLVAGSDIISHVDALDDSFVPLLTS